MTDFDHDRIRQLPDGSFIIDISTLEGDIEGITMVLRRDRMALHCFTNGEETAVMAMMWDEWYTHITHGDPRGDPRAYELAGERMGGLHECRQFAHDWPSLQEPYKPSLMEQARLDTHEPRVDVCGRDGCG